MSSVVQERKVQIDKLQQNLASIRKIAGWTAEALGNKIGVTKQTISNLESQKTPMSFAQYIAIRSVLDCEIESREENDVLQKVVFLLLDSDNALDDDDYTKVQDVVGTVAATAAGGASGAKLDSVLNALLDSLPVVASILGAIGAVVIGSSINWKRLLK